MKMERKRERGLETEEPERREEVGRMEVKRSNESGNGSRRRQMLVPNDAPISPMEVERVQSGVTKTRPAKTVICVSNGIDSN